MGTLVPANIVAPGFFGINRQVVITEDFRWAFDALNCVIDNSGRLAARKGRRNLTTTAVSASAVVRALAEHIATDASSTIISAANNKLYSGTSTLTDITGTAAGVTGITADNWQFQNINGKLVGFQDGHDPVVRTTGNFSLLQQDITAWQAATAYVLGDVVRATASNKTLYFQCTTAGTSGGSEPAWSTGVGTTTSDNTAVWTTRKMPNGNVCHSAFSRIWVTSDGDDTVIEFSDTLIPHRFRGGAAGTLDLKTVWGGDTVVAIDSFEDMLIIFGRKHILFYTGADDPSTMALREKIEGLGCVARDSVQKTAKDLVFLSDSGVRLLSRVVASGGREPIGDLSINVRDYLMGLYNSETPANIKSAYHEADGFYVITLPSAGFEFVFDLRFPNPDSSAKVTMWSGMDATALLSARNRTLYVGHVGALAEYAGYNDTLPGSITGTYLMRYRSTWSNFGQEVAQRFKMLKKLRAIVATTTSYIINFFFGSDFNEDAFTQSASTSASSGGAEWGTAEWGIAEWSGSGRVFTQLMTSPSGHGTVLKFGWDVTINGGPIGFQELSLLAKLGRLH